MADHAPPGLHRHPRCAACVIGRASPPGRCPFHDAKLPAGTLLHAQGEVPEHVYYVCAGTVLLSASDEDGAETTCALRGPGNLIGLEALGGRQATHGAWALSPLECCVLGEDELAAWLGERAVPLGAMLELALDEADSARRERIAMTGRASTRVARFLDAWHRERSGIPLELEQQVLARMLGMRPETLSRTLSRLRHEGVLASIGLRVLDAARLGALAHADEE